MMLYLPAEGGEVQRRNRRNALKNAKVEIDFKITDLHKTAPHHWRGAVLCCASRKSPVSRTRIPATTGTGISCRTIKVRLNTTRSMPCTSGRRYRCRFRKNGISTRCPSRSCVWRACHSRRRSHPASPA